ncbi:LOW QUALITY PROTEIN: extracellular solute-binding protein, partial [Kutzneria sp. 744]
RSRCPRTAGPGTTSPPSPARPPRRSGRASTGHWTPPSTTPARCSRGCASAARISAPRAVNSGFGADELTEWFDYWAGLRRSGAITPPDLLANAGEASGTHPLIAGQIAMTTGWGLAQMQPLTPHTLDIVVVPRSKEGKTGEALNGGVLLCVPAKSHNPDGAAKLIDFFVSDDDAIKAMGIQRGLPPSDKALNLLLPTFDAAGKRDVTYGQYVAQQAAKDGLPNAPTAPPGYKDVKTALDNAAKQIAFGKTTIADGVSQFFSDAKTALANAK